MENPSEPGLSPRIQFAIPLKFRAGPRPDQLGVRGLILAQYRIRSELRYRGPRRDVESVSPRGGREWAVNIQFAEPTLPRNRG